MDKFSATLSIIFIFIIGCPPAISANDPIPQEKQRALSIRTSSQQGAVFLTSKAKQLLEFSRELKNQDDRANFSSDNQYKANSGDWIIEQDSRNKDDSNSQTNGFGPFNNAWLLLKSKTNLTQYAIANHGTLEARSLIEGLLLYAVNDQADRYGLGKKKVQLQMLNRFEQ